MGTDGSSRTRVAAVLVLVGAFVLPAVAPWFGFSDLPSVGTETLVRFAGLGIVVLVALLLVRQKRLARGRVTSADGNGRSGGASRTDADDRRKARRESGRGQERAEQVTEAERDIYEWR